MMLTGQSTRYPNPKKSKEWTPVIVDNPRLVKFHKVLYCIQKKAQKRTLLMKKE